MKRLMAMLLSVLIITTTTMPKADAAVSIVLRSRTIKVIGGITTATGAVSVATGAIIAKVTGSWAALGFIALGVYAGVCGLIILDEKNTDMTFSPLNRDWATKLEVTDEELEIYNSEIEELNMIKEVIESRITDRSSPETVDALWRMHMEYLSPETMRVAAQVVLKVFANK